VVVCVLAQLINSAAQPVAMPLRKRRVVGFIDSGSAVLPNSPESSKGRSMKEEWSTRDVRHRTRRDRESRG
jgi:hypothetical protein